MVTGLYLGVKIKYTNDTVILVESIDLQLHLNRITTTGLKSQRVAKTKFMGFSRQNHGDTALYLSCRQIEGVNKLKYLDSFITADLDSEMEAKCRNKAFKLGWGKEWLEALCGLSSYTEGKSKVRTMNMLEVFEMWIQRRKHLILCVLNDRVLQRARTYRKQLSVVKCRKTGYLGYVLNGAEISASPFNTKRKNREPSMPW